MTKQFSCIYYTSFDRKMLFKKYKTKTTKPQQNMFPNGHCCLKVNFCYKAAFGLVQNYGTLPRFHQQIHAQISFTHGHFQSSFLVKAQNLGDRWVFFLQRE